MTIDGPHVRSTLRAGRLTVGELLSSQAQRTPNAIALVDGDKTLDFASLNRRANRLADALTKFGIVRGDRVAILSENRFEYMEAAYAAAKSGAILCTLNWRLAKEELNHCIALVEPKLVLTSARFAEKLGECEWNGLSIDIDRDYEQLLSEVSDAEPAVVAEPEDGLFILYTSGTTGFPKGALISHRAELARMDLSRIDAELSAGDSFIAWAPMFHMVSLEHAIHVHGLGGKVSIVDGAKISAIVDYIEADPQWWVIVLPGMIDEVIEELRRRNAKPKGVKRVGVLADLLPPKTVADISSLLSASFWNTFGSTETGMVPLAGSTFAPGVQPASVSKTHNSLYTYRLVDENDADVPPGQPGEIAVRGPTVFSGYWNADDVNAREFRGGYFHMGDMFVELPDGRFNYVDRSKYMIKSGAENIYPLEIERILLTDPAVVEAVVVRKRDARWGEVPVAFVALEGAQRTAEELIALCRGKLATYKAPREIWFVDSPAEFPRSTSGKVQRQLVELWVK
jgi:acyl-CoA synthetase (AMP-forming)/AMP-acid ligase II